MILTVNREFKKNHFMWSDTFKLIPLHERRLSIILCGLMSSRFYIAEKRRFVVCQLLFSSTTSHSIVNIYWIFCYKIHFFKQEKLTEVSVQTKRDMIGHGFLSRFYGEGRFMDCFSGFRDLASLKYHC